MIQTKEPHSPTRSRITIEEIKENGLQVNTKKNDEAYYRCVIKGYWSCTCCTIRHLVDLHEASIMAKRKEKETNFTDFDDIFGDQQNESMDITHLDISDSFAGPNGTIDNLIDDGNAKIGNENVNGGDV